MRDLYSVVRSQIDSSTPILTGNLNEHSLQYGIFFQNVITSSQKFFKILFTQKSNLKI
jgi:hypothetical protein